MAFAKNKQAAQQVETQERRALTLKLRKSGATYEQIARAVIEKYGVENLPRGYDSRYTYKDVARELQRLKNLVNGLAVDVKELELQRLDRMLMGVWQQAISGDLGAIKTVLRIMDRRAKLVGLDSAQKLEIDWRREAEADGINASELFERLVNVFANSMDGSGDSGSVPGS